MNNYYPEFVKVGGKEYKLNTDYRIALECDNIVKDDSIGEFEKISAIIYKLLGDEGLDDFIHEKVDIEKLFNLLIKYLFCNKNIEKLNNDDEPSMEFEQDMPYIRASFSYCYPQEDLNKEMHWWKFNELLQGLTEDCVMNRIRYIREEPLGNKKGKEYQNLLEAKRLFALQPRKTEKEKYLDKVWDEKMRKE